MAARAGDGPAEAEEDQLPAGSMPMMAKVGIWTGQLDYVPASEVRAASAQVEDLGYRALWTGEAVGREVFGAAHLLLGATEQLVVATGIANIWARDALAMVAAEATLAEAYPGRFILGIGASHAPLVAQRGQDYRRPLSHMGTYLEHMEQARSLYRAVPPASPAPLVLAALGPRMLDLARDGADGAHTYFVPPPHTEAARSRLGPAKLLVPEQAAVLETDPTRAREVARRHTAAYLRLPNYRANLARLGYGEDDLEVPGSDRLVDDIVAWGGEEVIVDRVRAHLDAGADHVALQVLSPEPRGLPLAQWRALAPALLSL